MSKNDAPIDGYVDPSIPNPNGEGDAPIIIYGYISRALSIPSTQVHSTSHLKRLVYGSKTHDMFFYRRR